MITMRGYCTLLLAFVAALLAACVSQSKYDAVMQYLISQDVKPELVSAQGHGDSDPVAPNTSAKARAQNRRVEITLASPSG